MIYFAYTDRYLLDLPADHKFPISKYALVREQLLYEGSITEAHLFDPGLCSEEDILAIHTAAYWQKVKHLTLDKHEVRRIGLPLNEQLVRRSLSSSSGTLKTALHALEHRAAVNLAGGTHHAFSYKGEGFCVLNDIAIAASHLLRHQLAQQILVIDLDVHQGNGTAQIFQQEPRVFTFSMHGADNYPLKKEKSDLDIALPSGIKDEEYLSILYKTVPVLIKQHQPDFIFYQAGVDVLATDKLGKLGLSKQGCRDRDKFVLETCAQLGIPLAITMGGGYSARLADIVDAHCNTFRLALEIFS